MIKIDPSINQEKLQMTLLRVIRLLVESDFDGLEALTEGQQLSAEQIRQEVRDWPSRLVMPPDDSLESLVDGDVLEISDSCPKRWFVDAILYSEDEGRSDLTPSLTLADTSDEIYKVRLESLHVL